MYLDWLLAKLKEKLDHEALIWGNKVYSYGWILDRYHYWMNQLQLHDIRPGDVVAVEADYSPSACSLMLALIDNSNIFVPLTSAIENQKEEFTKIAEATHTIRIHNDDEVYEVVKGCAKPSNELLNSLISKGKPGLILFSSGSTGKSKAALHDFSKLLEKFKKPRQSKRMLAFLLLDHIGGINTLLYALSNAGTVITVKGRTPQEICEAIHNHHAQVLPTSPTFLNLLILSEAYKNYDLSSLELITYGTEVMPESTLSKIRGVFPNVTFQQTYGLSELGILRSKSQSSDSLWVKIGGEGYETKIVDNILWIKAESAMLGYLNAPNPFDSEGWFNTQDEVLVDGDYIKILGRKSEIINVGGEKVYPAEVESVLMQMENVIDAVIISEKHPITGNIIVAKLNVDSDETEAELRRRVRDFCKDKLAPFKIPAKVHIVENKQFSERYKKMRR